MMRDLGTFPRQDPSTAAYITERTRFVFGCICIVFIGFVSILAALKAEDVERRNHIERAV